LDDKKRLKFFAQKTEKTNEYQKKQQYLAIKKDIHRCCRQKIYLLPPISNHQEDKKVVTKKKDSADDSTVVQIVTAKELSQYLKLSESTIYKLAANGEIPGFKIGDSWRFDLDEVMAKIRGIKTRGKS
jgi:excisionase family DNA binding protein